MSLLCMLLGWVRRWWPGPPTSCNVLFFMHLDETASVHLYRDVHQRYTVELTERLERHEIRQCQHQSLPLLDAYLLLGVTMAVHACAYQALHDTAPPYLRKLYLRLTRGETP